MPRHSSRGWSLASHSVGLGWSPSLVMWDYFKLILLLYTNIIMINSMNFLFYYDQQYEFPNYTRALRPG
jgi:hypothetical protein